MLVLLLFPIILNVASTDHQLCSLTGHVTPDLFGVDNGTQAGTEKQALYALAPLVKAYEICIWVVQHHGWKRGVKHSRVRY